MNKKHWKKSYTLVELLVVVAVMAIIMSIALPSFTKMAKGQAPKNAAIAISSKIKAARAYAITERKCVAIVFPDRNCNDSYEVDANLCYTTYRACIVEKDGSIWRFKEPIPGEGWETVPTSVVIFKKSAGKIIDGATELHEKSSSNMNTDLGIGKTSPANYSYTIPALIFQPSGMLVVSTSTTEDVSIRLNIGMYTKGNDPVVPTDTENNYFEIAVNQFTGKVNF
ncbi:MAG: hypothetical protein BWY74_04052 [Firmicutes bacterium ADurb.Bin419]|nr:MAG: hypothetical protein BWY74_04052 [Firmicutes bacterium ADurb.Bin419]